MTGWKGRRRAYNNKGFTGSRAGELRLLSPLAYICMVLAATGSLVCGVRNIIMWLLLAFSCYTDIAEREIYIFPIRVGIIVEMVRYAIVNGFKIEGYVELLLCMVIIVLLSRVFKAYAEGDLEIFIMLVLSAAVRGEGIMEYTLKLLWLSGVCFVLMLAVYMLLYNIQRLSEKKRPKIIMEAPMVPSIAAAYIMCFMIS